MQLNREDFANPKQISLEVQRRALAIAQSTLDINGGEDPFTLASRQVFHELLMRIAEEQKAA